MYPLPWETQSLSQQHTCNRSPARYSRAWSPTRDCSSSTPSARAWGRRWARSACSRERGWGRRGRRGRRWSQLCLSLWCGRPTRTSWNEQRVVLGPERGRTLLSPLLRVGIGGRGSLVFQLGRPGGEFCINRLVRSIPSARMRGVVDWEEHAGAQSALRDGSGGCDHPAPTTATTVVAVVVVCLVCAPHENERDVVVVVGPERRRTVLASLRSSSWTRQTSRQFGEHWEKKLFVLVRAGIGGLSRESLVRGGERGSGEFWCINPFRRLELHNHNNLSCRLLRRPNDGFDPAFDDRPLGRRTETKKSAQTSALTNQTGEISDGAHGKPFTFFYEGYHRRERTKRDLRAAELLSSRHVTCPSNRIAYNTTQQESPVTQTPPQ